MARYEAKIDIGGEFEVSFSLPLFSGDSGSSVALEFYNRGKAYDMSGAMIYARRSDGTVLASSGVTKGNKAEFTLYNNMYASPGELQVQVSVIDVYGNFLTSGILYFTVQDGFAQQSEGEGSNDFCELTSLIRQVGEGLNHIERAESAASVIEDFFQKVPHLEEQVVKLLSESELDHFTDGFAMVSASKTTDSDAGPILTEYQYPLIAESQDLFGNISVNQIRFYDGKLQKRTVGGTWTELSSGGTVEISEDSMNYKGTRANSIFLPTSNNSVGDVWNVKLPATISKKVYVANVSYGGYAEAIGNAIFYTSELPVSSGGVEVYDTSMNYIFYADIQDTNVLWYQGEFEGGESFESGEYYLIFTEENTSYNNTEIPLYKTGENSKFIWTGSEWQTFTGDMSKYATKEEIGDIETALSNIEALQNLYIGGDSV